MAINPSWFKTFDQLDPADPNALIKVRKKILKEAAAKTAQKECKQLEQLLNELLVAQKSETINGKTIGQMIAERMEKEDLMEGVTVTGSFGVTSLRSQAAIAEYKQKMKDYEATAEKIEAQLSNPPKDAEAAIKIFLAEQGRLNKIRGDVFEGFVQIAMETIKENVSKLAEAEVDKVLAEIKRSLESTGVVKTAGSSHVKATGSGISSQGKIDIAISQAGPFKEDWNISAKSYGSLRDISLVKGANGPAIIGAWPASQKVKNYYNNAISVYAPGSKGITEFLDEAENIIGLQGLVSHKGTAFANYLVLYIRNRKTRPIVVIPMAKYIETLLEQDENPFLVQLQTQYLGNTVDGVPALSEGDQRSPDVALEVYQNLKVQEVALKSAFLTLKKLESLGF